ncbi:MAG: VWA domain-containing protein [Desulfurococcales archaeon]|nr:VWA domain-containing protein [Desulfurococcales archaeon]
MPSVSLTDPLQQVRVELSTAADSVPPGGSTEFLARIVSLATVRQRLALAVAIDVSPSMDGERIFFAKYALINLLDKLEPGDTIAVIAFCRRATVVYGPKTIESGDDIMEAKRVVARLKLCPGTNIADALEKSVAVAKEMVQKGGVARVIFLTDGQPTVGEKKPEKIIERLYRALGEEEIPIVAIGIGREYNEALLLEIAESTNGSLEHISDLLELDKFIAQEAMKAAQVVAKNVQLTLRHPHWLKVEVYGRKHRTIRDQTIIDIGYLSSGEVIDVGGAFRVPEEAREDSVIEVRFKVKYIDQSRGIPVESAESDPLKLRVSRTVGRVDEFVRYKVNLMRASVGLKDAIRTRDYRKAVEYLRVIAEGTLSLGDLNLREKTVDILEMLERGEVEEGARRAASLAHKLSKGEE